jgi:hypothetical protein
MPDGIVRAPVQYGRPGINRLPAIRKQFGLRIAADHYWQVFRLAAAVQELSKLHLFLSFHPVPAAKHSERRAAVAPEAGDTRSVPEDRPETPAPVTETTHTRFVHNVTPTSLPHIAQFTGRAVNIVTQ